MNEEKATILIIEDDLDVADMLNAYFRVQGYQVLTVNWGEDGVRAAQTNHPDLIILDLRYGVGWTLSTQKIKGALREDPKEKTGEWAAKYAKDKTIVTYCT